MHRRSNGRRRPAFVGCWNAALAMVVTAVLATRLPADDYKPYNAEAAKIKNPLDGTPEEIQQGKKLYLRHCASCHGKEAKGDGALALSGGEPSNLTDEQWDTGSTDGEIFVAIRDGLSSDMLAYKEKLKEKEIWQVVLFLRGLSPKAAR